MNIRTLLLSAASLAALLPHVSHASAENAALNACARAFAASMAPAGASAPTFKLKYLGGQRGSTFADYYSGGEYTFYLKAHNPKTGMTLARATCTTDMQGTHVALTSTPLDGQEAALSAQL